MDKNLCIKSSKAVLEMNDNNAKLAIVTPEDIDNLPKFIWGKNKIVHDLQEVITERTYRKGNREILIRITAAIITRTGSDGNKTIVAAFPGEREEFVDAALRKLAVSRGDKLLNDQAGVAFTLYELREELKATGHTYSTNEIKEALFILKNAAYECLTEQEVLLSTSFISFLSLTNADELKSDSKKQCFVQFNPVTHKAITGLDFNPYTYSISMSLKSALARIIYKKIRLFWTQTSTSQPHAINLISFLQSTPRGLTNGIQGNKRAMESALEALKDKDVIDSWASFPVYAVASSISGRKGKILDYQYSIYPHPNLVKDILYSNSFKKKLKKIEKETLI